MRDQPSARATPAAGSPPAPARAWRLAYFALLAAWVTGAALFMARVRGGFATSYLSDAAFPPWFYIHLRGLHAAGTPARLPAVGRWFGQTPLRAALSIFAVGAVAELKTRWWPGGPIAGTYDPLDLVAYAAGLAACLVFEHRKR